MFDEYSTICCTVSRSVPRVCASWITRSATLIVGSEPERRARSDDPLLQRRRDGHELERRSRLVRVRDGAVPATVGTRRREPVGVEARRGRHREDLARVRIHDDRGRRARSPAAHGLLENLLRVRLDLAVDRQANAPPGVSGFVSTTSSARPNGSLTIVWLPGCPASVPSSERSRPSRPLLSSPA